MASIRARKDNGILFFGFMFAGARCREQTSLPDTAANRKRLEKVLQKIEAEITLGTFEYGKYIPNSPKAEKLSKRSLKQASVYRESPLFSDFVETWYSEMLIQWRPSHAKTVRLTLDTYLLPAFNGKEVARITWANILEFRSTLAKVTSRSGRKLSASRINKIMTPLRMILNEAADRFEFSSPYQGINSLKVPKTDVEPFSMAEVQQILDAVRPDFRYYYIVRFFTGMRTGEIDGLQWEFVDFERRQILVRQTLLQGELQYTKNDG